MLLYESLNQPINFLYLFLAGFLAAIVFDAAKYLTFLCNNNKVMQKIFDCLSVCFAGFVFFAACLVFNFGQFRFYLLCAFLLGILTERITLGLSLAKICKFCYLKCKKLLNFAFRKNKNETNRKI